MVVPDPRRTVGSTITAKAIHVTNGAECSRRYGSNRETKRVHGIIVEIINKVNKESGRKSCMVVADYNLGGGFIKRATLKSAVFKVLLLHLLLLLH